MLTKVKIRNDFRSPNFADDIIPAEFVVIHYTGCSLSKTLEIFTNEKSRVCAHFVIDEVGVCFDLGNFLSGPIRKGAHAGRSYLKSGGLRVESFNDFSVGIELVNLNGNLFDYPDAQYESLAELLSVLQKRFVTLKNSNRIVGHEHIAFWRGKSDPGIRFDWNNLFLKLKMSPSDLHEFHAASASDIDFLKAKINEQGMNEKNSEFWPALSTQLETRIANREKSP